MKIAWLTDPHLNFAGIARAEALMTQIKAMRADCLLVSGDIGEAHDLEGWLGLMSALACPTYFVLGNHDFYGSSIAQVRALAAEITHSYDKLSWLGACDVIALSAHTALVGHDGWGDARAGSMATSRVMLADFTQIQELRGLSRVQLALKLHALGDEAAAFLAPRVRAALSTHQHVIVLMHVPPSRESAWHEGARSDEEWAPFFVCEAVGVMLLEAMRAHPEKMMTVLCGHTHSGGECWMAANLRVKTGAAVYRKPALQDPLIFL